MITKVLLGVLGLAAGASDESCALQVQASNNKEHADWTEKKINTTYIQAADVIPEVIFGTGGNINGDFAVTQIQFTEFQLARRGKFMKMKGMKGSMSELEVDPEEEIGSKAPGYYGRGRGRRGHWWKRSVQKTLDRINKRNEKKANQWEGCVELGLRAKVRLPTPANDFRRSGITYGEFGIDGQQDCTCKFGFAAGPAACWNFEYHINTNFCGTGDLVLANLTYSLCVYRNDTGITNISCFDVINEDFGSGAPCFDHALGNNSNGNGESVNTVCRPVADTAGYQENINQFNVAQNSWNTKFFAPLWNANITDEGAYIVSLSASKDMPDGYGSTLSVPIGETTITVLQTNDAICSVPP